MELDQENSIPIYRQIAQWLEGEILSGRLEPEERMYSQYQLADIFNINPATAAKGLNLLAAEQIIYKKRGLGMFISMDARSVIFEKRKENTLKKLIRELVQEAGKLGIQRGQLMEMLDREMEGEDR